MQALHLIAQCLQRYSQALTPWRVVGRESGIHFAREYGAFKDRRQDGLLSISDWISRHEVCQQKGAVGEIAQQLGRGGVSRIEG